MNIENDIIQDELKCNWLFSQTITQGIHPVYICIHEVGTRCQVPETVKLQILLILFQPLIIYSLVDYFFIK